MVFYVVCFLFGQHQILSICIVVIFDFLLQIEPLSCPLPAVPQLYIFYRNMNEHLVFWDASPHYLVARNQHLRPMLTLSSLLLFHSEDEGSKLVYNIGTYLPKQSITSHRTAVLILINTHVHNVVAAAQLSQLETNAYSSTSSPWEYEQ